MTDQRWLNPALFSLLVGTLLLLSGCSGGEPATKQKEGMQTPASPVVAQYADTSITLSEFEKAYEKSNGTPPARADSFEAYKTFLDQYVNYRLKVRAAQEAGLDTLPSVRQEVRSYRQEMARPKIMRSEVYEPLVRTLYERRQEEVEVSHILTRVSPDAPPEDTLQAYKKMQAIADSLQRGVSFGELAFRNSEDPSAQKKGRRGYKGRLGYLRAGQIVAPFEDRMYSVAPDSVSDIFRTQYGYHILKVHDRRPAQQPFRLSHIMIRPQDDTTRARQLLDSLRTEIVKNDADFATLAKEFSEDRQSASRGGDLGQVESSQSLPPAFRKAMAQLDSVGAVSDVVQSQYGYHLIKLTDREKQKSFEEAYEDLKKKISGRPRVERRKDQFARTVRAEEGVSVDTARILETANIPSLDSLSRPLLSIVDSNAVGSARVATLGDSTFTLNQIARHVMQTDGGARKSLGEVLNDFLNKKAVEYAAARLVERDPSFASTMKEYREGLLVFQFMQDSVWTAAAQDSAGLRRTFEEQRDKYRYPDRVRTILLRAQADSMLAPYQNEDTETRALSSVVQQASADSLVTVDTLMVTDSSPEGYRKILSVDDSTAIGPFERENTSVYLIRDTLLPSRRKTFEEARSSVVRDYQDRYEDKVIKRLRERYEVKTYPERLRQAFGASATESSGEPASSTAQND